MMRWKLLHLVYRWKNQDNINKNLCFEMAFVLQKYHQNSSGKHFTTHQKKKKKVRSFLFNTHLNKFQTRIRRLSVKTKTDTGKTSDYLLDFRKGLNFLTRTIREYK